MNVRIMMRLSCLIVFACYMYLVIKVTLLSSYNIFMSKNVRPPVKLTPEVFQLIATRSADFIIRNLLGNLALFVPFGLLVPVFLFKKSKSMGIECGIVVLLGFLISLTIELVQHYVVFRIFDIDDIILNTVGTAVGYFFFLVARHILVRNVNIGGEHHEGNQ